MLIKWKSRAVLFGLLPVLGLFYGCGGPAEPEDWPDRTQVSGTVTYQGEAVEGATVTFHPEVPDGKGAFGRTDEQGRFVMGTFGHDDGVVPGSYQVTIQKMETPSTPQVSEDDPAYDPNAPQPEPKHLLPEKYSAAAQSGLTATVGTERIRDLTFELSDN